MWLFPSTLPLTASARIRLGIPGFLKGCDPTRTESSGAGAPSPHSICVVGESWGPESFTLGPGRSSRSLLCLPVPWPPWV